MLKLLGMINDKVEKVEEYCITYLLMIMSTVIFLQIIMRYVFNNSLTWSEEFAILSMMWITWIGSSYGVKKNIHLRVTVFVDMLPEKYRIAAYIVIDVVWMLFSIVMVVMGIRMVKMSYIGQRMSPALDVPMYLIYCSVVVGCILMSLSLVSSIYRRTGYYKKDAGTVKP